MLLCLVRNWSAHSPKRVADARDKVGSMVGGEAEIGDMGYCSVVGVLCRGSTPQGGSAEVGSSAIYRWVVENDMFLWP